jgi:hypothetical protein
MLVGKGLVFPSGGTREKMAELIRIAIRNARAEGDTETAEELISILEDMDRQAVSGSSVLPLHGKI